MATAIDDNAADEKSDKSIWRLLNIRCTRIERKWSGDMKLGLIMLAAGNSRRFGSNKLLYGIDGMPMYRHILLELKKVKAALEEQGHRCEITVVTQYEEIAQEAEKLGTRFLYNLHPDEGDIFFTEDRAAGQPGDGCLFVYGGRSAVVAVGDGFWTGGCVFERWEGDCLCGA